MVRSPMHRVAMPCREITEPKPFRLFRPYLSVSPGGRVTPHYGVLPGQSKAWSTCTSLPLVVKVSHGRNRFATA